MGRDINSLSQIEKTLHSHPFIASRFIQSPHIQSAFARLIPYFTMAMKKPEKRFIETPDGTKLAADCWFQKDKEKHATVVFLNGFEGYSKMKKTNFARTMSMKAYHFGFNAIHLKQRGETDTIHLTKSFFTAYSGLDDITIALREFKKWGLTQLYLVGLSYGGYLLLHTLNRLDEKEHCYVKGAVTIDAPLESFSTWRHIEKNRLYDLWLLRNYKHMVKRRAVVDSLSEEEIKVLKNIKTKRQFMDTYKHTFGYPKKTFTFEEYVEATDVPLSFFRRNTVPLLLICAYDDPIVPTEVYPTKDIANNPHIVSLFTKHGGHGGFFTLQSRYGDLDGHWAHNRAIEFIRLLAENHKSLA